METALLFPDIELTNQHHLFRSEEVWDDPTESATGKTFDVFIDPADLTRYVVDISFLLVGSQRSSFWRRLFDVPAWVKSKIESYKTIWNQWNEGSLDYRMALFYYLCMFGLVRLKGSLGIMMQLALTVILVFGLVQFSLWNRYTSRWAWLGRQSTGYVQLWKTLRIPLLGLTLLAFFFPPTDPSFLPLTLLLAGFMVFQILRKFGIVSRSRAEFIENCEPSTSVLKHSDRNKTRMAREEAHWKRITRAPYQITFALCWLEVIFSFYFAGYVLLKGARAPTQSQFKPMATGGTTVFITLQQDLIVDRVRTIAFICVILMITSTFIVHYGPRLALLLRKVLPKRRRH